LITVVGTGLSLPFDVEPYGPGDSEHSASRRLLGRAVHALGPRFADYVVVDGAYANAPFLHTACALGLHPVARLKNNVPELMAAATARFATQAPSSIQQINGDRVELWDADDFDLAGAALAHRPRPSLSATSARRLGVRGLLAHRLVNQESRQR
jgi:hypothetical protein